MSAPKEAAKRILVVDDEESIRNLLYDFLTEYGYKTVTVRNGQEALDVYRQGRTDIVLLDLVMRPMDGMEVLNALIKMDPAAFVIMITGHPSLKSATEALKKGAKDYISKPLDLDELRFKLQRVLLERSLKEKLKSSTGILWALVISIPVWLILGIILAKLLK